MPAGPNFTIPDVGELNWGQEVTNFLVALPHGIPPTAGTFALTGDLSFGPSFGLVGKYLISVNANPSATGFLRLSHPDTLSWRNNANTADLPLGVNSSDQLTFNGSVPAFTGAVNTGVQFQLGYYATNGGTISGLTLIAPNMTLESDSNGLPVASSVSSATLAFLDATSSVQTQINNVVSTANAALPKAGGTMSGPINMGNQNITGVANGVNPQDAVTVSQIGASVFQSGDLKAAAYSATPSGWLLCDGTSYATATYPSLFAAIGYFYGGAGANFNVPNLVNSVPVGQGGSIAPALGSASGSTTHALSIPEMPSHTHTITDPTHTHGLWTSASNTVTALGIADGGSSTIPGSNGVVSEGYRNGFGANADQAVQSVTTGITVNNTGGSGAFGIVQPSLGVNWFIKI